MSYQAIEEYFRNGRKDEAIRISPPFLQKLLGREPIFSQIIEFILPKKMNTISPIKRVKLLCNWCSSETLHSYWAKMSQDGNGKWDSISLALEEPIDFTVVLNATNELIDPKRTIVFQMEPKMESNPSWGSWAKPDEKAFKAVFTHKTEMNNIEWHLKPTYQQLCSGATPILKTKLFSTIISGKYTDIGQIKRTNFVKFLEKKGIEIDIFGRENPHDFENYQGSLPTYEKDNGLFPYKYTFACENMAIPNYFTEKLIDGILSECLVFYSGCPNVREYIDPRAFVQLELSNFEADTEVIQTSIATNAYERAYPYILEAKAKILNELQFFPRLAKLLSQTENA